MSVASISMYKKLIYDRNRRKNSSRLSVMKDNIIGRCTEK